MAEKKTAAKKPRATKAKQAEEEVVKAEETEVKEDKKTEKKAEKKERKIEKDDRIPVMNNTTGTYFWRSHSGYTFEMNEYGEVVDVPFDELRQMRSEARRNIDEAFVVILDEDAIQELRLEKLYENVLDADGVEEVLNDYNRLEEMIDKMPKMMKVAVGTVAKRKFEDGELYDMRVAKLMKDKIGISVSDNV